MCKNKVQNIMVKCFSYTFNSSTSTFMKVTVGSFLANSAKNGAMKRQGPHHDAVKSTTICIQSTHYMSRKLELQGLKKLFQYADWHAMLSHYTKFHVFFSILKWKFNIYSRVILWGRQQIDSVVSLHPCTDLETTILHD